MFGAGVVGPVLPYGVIKIRFGELAQDHTGPDALEYEKAARLKYSDLPAPVSYTHLERAGYKAHDLTYVL